MSYQDFQTSNNPPWLQGTNGNAWFSGLGALKDYYTDLIRQAVRARFPTQAPADALGYVADERGLSQGPTESNGAFALRLRAAWNIWPYAGTPIGLLANLWFAGFPNAVIAQQNGLGFNYSAAPNINDYTQNLVVTSLVSTIAPYTPVAPAAKTIPTGSPWWAYDFNNDFCSRYSILFPGPLPSVFTTWATATFTGVEDGSIAHPWPTATWSRSFPDTAYKVQCGPPTLTDGLGPVKVWVDGSTKTQTTVSVKASAKFTGSVDLLGYGPGANPYVNLQPVDLTRLKNVIKQWAPAKATCLGVFVTAQGAMWGWPVRKWGNGDLWQSSTIVRFPPT